MHTDGGTAGTTISGMIHETSTFSTGQPQLIAPAMAKLGKVLKGILPVRAWDFVGGKVFGIYTTMDSFTGRDEKAGTR